MQADASLRLNDFLEPRPGVYAAQVSVNARCYDAVAVFGGSSRSQTVPTVDIHLLDAKKKLQGQWIELAIIDFISPNVLDTALIGSSHREKELRASAMLSAQYSREARLSYIRL